MRTEGAMRPGEDAPLGPHFGLQKLDHAVVAPHRNGVFVFHIACRITASFRTVATWAFLKPMVMTIQSSNNWISHAGWKSFKLALFLAERACQLIGEWLEEIRNRRARAGLNKGLDGHPRNEFEPAQHCAGLIVDLDPHNIIA